VIGYRPVRRKDVTVCIGAFFPAQFRLPRAHLDWVFRTLTHCGVDVVFAQVVRTGQNRVRPPRRFRNIVYHCDSVLFHKESLWNLAARACDTPKILWIDGDVVFDDLSWIDRASEILDDCDLMQPFDVAIWLDQYHRPVASKKSAAYAFARGEEFDGRFHHPGFAWGMTRDFFNNVDGFYELHPLGGGDTSFAIALSRAYGQDVGDVMKRGMFTHAPSYQAYIDRLHELKPRVACQTNIVRHLWHGTLEKRQYTSRGKYAPALVDGEYPVRRRQDGLLEWLDPEGDRTMLEYFKSREEDG
jgi:hypothetical protein